MEFHEDIDVFFATVNDAQFISIYSDADAIVGGEEGFSSSAPKRKKQNSSDQDPAHLTSSQIFRPGGSSEEPPASYLER